MSLPHPDARFGDAGHELPRKCMLAPPGLVPEPAFGNWPATAYEALVVNLLGRGLAVPSHPSACATEGCGHAQVWHAHRTRDHACDVAGCACRKLARQPLARRAAEVAR